VRLSYHDINGDGIIQPTEILEENNYYPFGLKQEGYNDLSSPHPFYKYTYVGQEFQDDWGLNMTAMDFRQYDQALGRFNVMDALSEMAYDQTPYRYGFNNPVFWKDPSGLFETYAKAAKFISDNGITGSIELLVDGDPTQGYTVRVIGGEFDGDVFYDHSSPLVFSNKASGGANSGKSSESSIDWAGIGRTAADFTPILGGCLDCYEGYQNGDGMQIAMGVVSLIADGVTLGGSSLLKGTIKTGIKQGSKQLAKKAAKEAVKAETKAIAQFSNKTINDAVVYAMENKVTHVFGKATHNLSPLVNKLGGQENTFRAVLNAANGKLPASGIFMNVPVNVGSYDVIIRGNVVNGVPKIGTMFIP